MGSSLLGLTNWPDYNQFLSEAWGNDFEPAFAFFTGASNVVTGTNPPYTIADFLGVYPKFGGTPTILTGIVTLGSPVVTALSTTAGLLPGMVVSPVIPLNGNLIAGSFAAGTTILSVDSASQITMSTAAIGTTPEVAIYNAPIVPTAILALFVNLASASLVQARWQDSWAFAMALYTAHMATLYLQSDGDIYSSPGQAAVAGLARGIMVSKSAGGVSAGIQPFTGLEGWGTWNATTYGQQLATMAKLVGAGPMLLW